MKGCLLGKLTELQRDEILYFLRNSQQIRVGLFISLVLYINNVLTPNLKEMDILGNRPFKRNIR